MDEVRADLEVSKDTETQTLKGWEGRCSITKGIAGFPFQAVGCWWDVVLTGARGCSLPSGGGLRVGGEVGRGRTPVPTILRRLSSAAFLTVVQ